MASSSARRAFSTLVAAAFVDGELDDTEREVLHRKATQMSIPNRLMNDLIDRGAKGKLRISVPANAGERTEVLGDLVDVACADGRIESSEHRLLSKFASHIGVATADLRALVRERMNRKSAPAAPREPKIRIIEEVEPTPEETPEPRRPAPPLHQDHPDIEELEEAEGLKGYTSGPFEYDDSANTPSADQEIPPVTLGLLKQAILFDTERDALRYVERVMNVERPEAQNIIRTILRDNPEIRKKAGG